MVTLVLGGIRGPIQGELLGSTNAELAALIALAPVRSVEFTVYLRLCLREYRGCRRSVVRRGGVHSRRPSLPGCCLLIHPVNLAFQLDQLPQFLRGG